MYRSTYNNKILNSEKLPPIKKPFSWKKFLLFFSGILILVGLIFFIKNDRFQLKKIEIDGVIVVDKEEVSKFVMESLNGKYLYFFPKTSILLINSKSIGEEIKRSFPRFKSVEVNRSGFNSLRINTTEYLGTYLWCENQESSQCSFMDESGIVFAEAPYFSGDAYSKIYGGGNLKNYPFNPISNQNIIFIKLLKSKLFDIGIKTIDYDFISDDELSVSFYHNSQISKILINPNNDIDLIINIIYTGIRTEPLSTMYHEETKYLEYLDVRFDNKLIYKFK